MPPHGHQIALIVSGLVEFQMIIRCPDGNLVSKEVEYMNKLTLTNHASPRRTLVRVTYAHLLLLFITHTHTHTHARTHTLTYILNLYYRATSENKYLTFCNQCVAEIKTISIYCNNLFQSLIS